MAQRLGSMTATLRRRFVPSNSSLLQRSLPSASRSVTSTSLRSLCTLPVQWSVCAVPSPSKVSSRCPLGVMKMHIRAWSTANNTPPHLVVPMPEITPDMTHGTITAWTVPEGSLVSVGDTFCHIRVDNFTYDGQPGNMEVEAIETGYMARFLVQEGETVSKYDPIAIFSETPQKASEFAHFAPTQEEGRNTTFAWQAYTLPSE